MIVLNRRRVGYDTPPLSDHYHQKPAAVALLLLLFLCPLSGQGAAGQDDILSIIRERVDHGYSTSIVVGVLEADEERFYSYGPVSGNNSHAVDEDTIYEIGSVTKVFTTLLLANMAVRGQLQIDDAIDSLLPSGLKALDLNGQKVTFRHLATHTSGLPRMPENSSPENYLNPYADYTEEKLMEFLSGYTLPRIPGALYEYSNFGSGLLGYLLASTEDTTYEQLVETRICNTLGLKDTVISLSETQLSRFVTGYFEGDPVPPWDFQDTTAGCGALRSTARDLLTFLSVQLGRHENKQLRLAMEKTHRPMAPTGISESEIGLGWHINRKPDSELFWHNGGTYGSHSFIGFDKENRRAVVVLSNSYCSIDDIGFHILDHNFPLVIVKKEIKISPADYDGYVGVYEFTSGLTISVTGEDSRLWARVTGDLPYGLYPLSKTRFFYRQSDNEINFERGTDGNVTRLIVHTGGRNVPARRLE